MYKFAIRFKSAFSIALAIIMLVSSISLSAYASTKAPSKPKSPTFSSTSSSITVKWKKVTGAKGYVLYKYNASTKKYFKLVSTTKCSYKVSKLKAGTSYKYSVKAYKIVKNKKYYSAYSPIVTATTLPVKPVGLKATSTTNSVTINWKKVVGATSYTVYKYNPSKKYYTKLAATKNLSYKISNLNEGASYFFAIAANKVLNKKSYNSAKSNVITCATKVAAPSAPTKVASSLVTYNSAKISFSAGANAGKFIVEYAKNSNFTNSVKKSVSSKSANLVGLSEKTKYYVRVYAVRTVNGKNYTSNASAVIYFTTQKKYALTLSVVNESQKFQTINGFGASGCWWAQRTGRWTDEGALTERNEEKESLWTKAQTTKVLKYLYDDNEGIGLNIYRYNIGTDSYNDTTIVNKWSRTEGFLDSIDENGNMTYDWSKDQSAQNTLSVAKELAGDNLKVTLFANSPPTQLTDNGLAYCENLGVDYWVGNGGGLQETRYYQYHQNLPDNAKSYMTYAKFLCDVADHFVDNGYNVVDVSPVNEPQTSWSWGVNKTGAKEMSQEGCHYTPSGLAKLASYCALAGENKPYKFSMFDSGAADGADEKNLNCSSIKYINSLYGYGSYIKDENGEKLEDSAGNKTYKDINKNYYTDLSVHSYWSTKEDKQKFADYVANKYSNVKSFTCTEYCQMTNDENTGVYDISSPIPCEDPARNGLTIEYGVQLARIMNEDFTTLNATEWDWWTACSSGYYPDGLVYIDNENPDNIMLSKRLWAMGNYSKFVKEGAVRVAVTEAQSNLISSAFKNVDGSLVIVYVNQTKNNINTNISASGYSKYSVYETSATSNLDNIKNGSYSLDNAISIPSQSVVTVVLK